MGGDGIEVHGLDLHAGIRADDLPPEAVGTWRSLAESVSLFQSLEWVSAWSGVYYPEGPARVAWDGHAVAAYVPSARGVHRRLPIPIRYWTLAGSGVGAADYVGPACSDPVRGAQLLASTAPDPFYVESLIPSIAAQLGDDWRAFSPIPTPCLTLDPAAQGISFLDSMSSRRRKEHRRRLRRIEDAGLTAQWLVGGEVGAAYLARLDELSVMRGKQQGRSGGFPKGLGTVLIALAAGLKAETGGVRLLVLTDAAGTVQAGCLGVRWYDSYYELKTGWDPRLARLGAGTIMKRISIEDASTSGVRRYHMMRGGQPYKYELGASAETCARVLRGESLAARVLTARERRATFT